MKNTISQLWKYYRTKIIPKEASPIQVHECQLAFYAGTSAIIGELVKLGDSDISEDEGAAAFLEYINEVKSFMGIP